MTICQTICAGSEAWMNVDGPEILTPSGGADSAMACAMSGSEKLRCMDSRVMSANDKTEPRGGMNPQAANPKGTP